MSEQVLRINYAALPVPPCAPSRKNVRQRFRCWLDDGSPVGPETGLRSPALDGARWLIGQGVSPDRLMTTRAASSSVDSWKPAPVGIYAKLAVYDPDSDVNGLRLAPWRPMAVKTVCEKRATLLPAGVVIPDNGKGAENAPIDVPAGAGDDASNPAMARVGDDLPRNLSAACASRAAFAHGKDKSNG